MDECFKDAIVYNNVMDFCKMPDPIMAHFETNKDNLLIDAINFIGLTLDFQPNVIFDDLLGESCNKTSQWLDVLVDQGDNVLSANNRSRKCSLFFKYATVISRMSILNLKKVIHNRRMLNQKILKQMKKKWKSKKKENLIISRHPFL
mmetsp:Transcript_15710/g.20745  ORF Transcript_15710/g.20745 Transcript_15710/m.20745 type:complete len:147 (-) Transcript_15710:1153-1593(-)